MENTVWFGLVTILLSILLGVLQMSLFSRWQRREVFRIDAMFAEVEDMDKRRGLIEEEWKKWHPFMPYGGEELRNTLIAVAALPFAFLVAWCWTLSLFVSTGSP